MLSAVETSKKRSIIRGIPKLARGEYHYEVISLVQGTNITALAISLQSKRFFDKLRMTKKKVLHRLE